ncbi:MULTISPECIES: YIP1 family protein [Paenibacillus]|uniref:Yip1 domain-containing protein n=1 Tax=Paenibacillus albilobatus TaxID=2716884 RepID=A0A920CDR7_9BACL|nr:YIP1 family protein [Paenibacillus sp. USDA918EY]GIO34093.1 hypothetical protein J2TS6_52340 [Paenibacillus albilobatus]
MGVRKWAAWLLALALLAVGTPVKAEVPDHGYNYSYWREAEPAPYPYLAETTIYGSDLGIGHWNEPQDVFVDEDRDIFIADTGNNRIVHLDEKGKLLGVISAFDNGGKKDTFNKPSGVYVDRTNRHLFVADTQNGRVVEMERSGRLIRMYGPPVSSIIPKGFQYFPLKVAVDKTQRLYVIAQGAYEGIMEFDAKGNFRGYVGTNKVRFSPVDLFWKRFSTKEQSSQMQLFLPIEFANMDLDDKGFIYAVSSEVNAVRPLKRINPGGEDVLRREGYFDPAGDVSAVQVDAAKQKTIQNAGSSTFVDVIYDKSGIYSGLDSKRNRIFAYNGDGNMLYQFGGVGMSENRFQKPTAMAMLGDRMVVLDAGMNRLTVFAPTRYGSLIRAGVEAQYNGKDDEAAKDWEEVLKLNANFDIAYIGIGKSLLQQGENKQAMEYFKNGNNRKYYSEALNRYRSEYLWNHFGTAMTVVLGTAGALLALRIVRARRRVAVHYTDTAAWRMPLRTIVRPFSGFWELKYENKGKVAIAVFILLMLVVTMILKRQYAGFIVNFNKPSEFSSVDELKYIVLPFLLFCVSNWSLTTLMDGEGKFKEIVMAAGYAALPLVIIFLPQTGVSNFMTEAESPFYYLLDSIAYLWFAWLLFVGTMTVHQYSIGKTVATLFLTVLVMAFIVFLGILCFSLVQQMATFVQALYREIIVRL